MRLRLFQWFQTFKPFESLWEGIRNRKINPKYAKKNGMRVVGAGFTPALLLWNQIKRRNPL